MTEFFPVFAFVVMIVMTILSFLAFFGLLISRLQQDIKLGAWAMGGLLGGVGITFCACLSMAIVLAPK